MSTASIAEERRQRLLEIVRRRGFASLPELAGQLRVSESTVRRDVDQLEESGAAQRTHGGVYYTGPSPKLPHFDYRQSVNWDKKRQIAARAAALIEDGDTVLLDGGSTTYELAQVLMGRPLQIVTNSLPVANLFAASETVDLVVVGGYVHSRTGVTLGPYANEMLQNLCVRRAVLSVSGANEKGFYNSNLLLVETERAMMGAADEVIVLADSTKFGQSNLTRLCDLDRVDVLVVDEGIGDAWRDSLTQAGVRLLVAPPLADESSGLSVPSPQATGAKVSGAKVPSPKSPDSSVPDSSVPDSSVPDSSVPDSSVPDTKKPDSKKLGPEAAGES